MYHNAKRALPITSIQFQSFPHYPARTQWFLITQGRYYYPMLCLLVNEINGTEIDFVGNIFGILKLLVNAGQPMQIKKSLRIKIPNSLVMVNAHAIRMAVQLMYDNNQFFLKGAEDSGWMRLNPPVSDYIGVPAL